MAKPETEKILRDSHGISYGKLESLLLFAENASVTAAANERRREASSVTRHLDALDSHFGCTLRRKIGTKTTITPEGEELVFLLRRQLQEIKNFRDKHTNNLNTVSLAAGDSLLHVIVLPNLHLIQSLFTRTIINVSAARTHQIIEGLQDLTLDLGLLRQSSLSGKNGKNLTCAEIGDYRYAVFIPNNLWQSVENDEAKIFTLPFAMIKHHWDTNFIELARGNDIVFSDVRVLCENFIQVFHLVRLGQYAGILPLFCERLLRDVVCREPAFLIDQKHKVVLAWNPSLLEIRTKLNPFVDSAVKGLRNVFKQVRA